MSKHHLQAGPSSAHSQLIRVGNREVQRWYYWSSDQCSSVLDFILEAPTTRIGDFWRKPIFGQCMLPQLKPQRPQWLHCHPLSACLGCKGLGEGSSVTSNEYVINGVCHHAQRLPDTFTGNPGAGAKVAVPRKGQRLSSQESSWKLVHSFAHRLSSCPAKSVPTHFLKCSPTH